MRKVKIYEQIVEAAASKYSFKDAYTGEFQELGLTELFRWIQFSCLVQKNGMQ